MNRNKLSPWLIMLVFAILALSSCAATPAKPETEGRIFQESAVVVQKAAVDALIVFGFDIKKSGSFYIEGFRPHQVGLFAGSGGETVGIWLETLEASKTRVYIRTAKSLVGIVGQKNWDAEILAQMDKNIEIWNRLKGKD